MMTDEVNFARRRMLAAWTEFTNARREYERLKRDLIKDTNDVDQEEIHG